MALLNIKPTKKITVTCSLEESNILLADHYAAFVNTTGDMVIDSALSYIFKIDKEFQQYLAKNEKTVAPASLKLVKKIKSEPTGAKRGRKPMLAIAN